MINSLSPDTVVTVGSALVFPAIAFKMMYDFATKTLRKNTEAIHDLKLAIDRLKKK